MNENGTFLELLPILCFRVDAIQPADLFQLPTVCISSWSTNVVV